MTKQQFFIQLESRLKHLPEQERVRIMGVYEELFQKAMDNGKTEEQIADALGFPEHGWFDAANQPPTQHIASMENRSSAGMMIIASIALIFFNLIFVFGPYMGILGVLIALGAVAIGFILAPLALFALAIFDSAALAGLSFFAGLVLSGIGILLGIGMFHLFKWFFQATAWYVRTNLRWIRGL